MLNLNFFNQIANSFRDHYYNLVRTLDDASTYNNRRIPQVEPTVENQPQPTDQYLPSPEAAALAKSTSPQELETKPAEASPDEPASSETPEDKTPTEVAPEKNPDGTYYMKRYARLDYGMTLQFDLATLSRTVEQAAEGDSRAVEEFIAAGFGLRADMAFNGMERITESANRGETPKQSTNELQKSSGKASQAGAFAANSRNFALNSFFKEASSIRSSSHVINNHGHRLAINKFALRFSLDSRFDMSYLNRFNVQTRQVADQKPEAVNSYINSAGDLAASGSAEMMGAFFDAVGQYLNDTESKLIANATDAFDRAAAELGFEGSLVDAAKDQLVGSIESFFDRVDSAVTDLRGQYLPVSEAGGSPLPEGAVIIDDPKPTGDPAMLDESGHLAVA